MNWGSVPDWLAAAGTILAVTISLSLAIKEVRQRREAETLLSAERERARRSDASQVVAWLDVTPSGEADGRPSTHLRIQNSSARPVFSVRITPCAYAHPSRDQDIVVPVIGPGVSLSEPFDAALAQFVGLQDLPRDWLLDPAGLFGFRLVFRDSDGIGWERTLHGDLYEIPVDNVDATFFDPAHRAFTHEPWSRPPGWSPQT